MGHYEEQYGSDERRRLGHMRKRLLKSIKSIETAQHSLIRSNDTERIAWQRLEEAIMWLQKRVPDKKDCV